MPPPGRDLRLYGDGLDRAILRGAMRIARWEVRSDENIDYPGHQQIPRIDQARQEVGHARAAASPEDGFPTPAPPVFRRVWKEVAPGQWRWLHLRVDEQDPPAT